LRGLFVAFVEAKQRQNVLNYDDLRLYFALFVSDLGLAEDRGNCFNPKAMPVILTIREGSGIWMSSRPEQTLKLQEPLPDEALMIVARGGKRDEGGLAA
jgi:hypothetical protein